VKANNSFQAPQIHSNDQNKAKIKKNVKKNKRETSGFRRGAVEAFAVLECCAEEVGGI